jgi:hypothetical protein
MSSEMFLSILTLLQTNLPCSVNYYRYKNNYEKYVGEDTTADASNKSQTEEVVKSIASPRLMSKLSPVASFVKNQGINVNPMSQKGLLKYALNKEKKETPKYDSDSDDEDYSKFGSKQAAREAKAKRKQELEELRAAGKDQIDTAGAIRLPNRISKGITIDP